MIGQEAAGSPESSSGSESGREHRQTQRTASRTAHQRVVNLPPAPSAETAEADGGRARRGTGGGVGLSEKELQDLHKNDPKRAKRILANRSSAARSKVRKLRYISELESKSAKLQEEAASLLAELEDLHDKSVVLSKENDDLFRQAYSLQDHALGLDMELEQLTRRANGVRAVESRYRHLRQLRSAPVLLNTGMQHHAYTQEMFPVPGALQDMHEEHQLSLQFPSRGTMPQTPQQPSSFAALASLYQNPPALGSPFAANEGAPELAIDAHGLLSGAEVPGAAAVGSNNTADAGGGQTMKLAPDMNPALLELLTLKADIVETSQNPSLPPVGRIYQEDGTPLGVLSGLPSTDSNSSRTLSALGLQSSVQNEGCRHRSVSSVASSFSHFPSLPPTALPPRGLDRAAEAWNSNAQGVLRWPRRFSDPQGFHAY